jgi:hypothetical protein
MRLFADELGRFDYLLHILKNLLRFVKYFQKNFLLGFTHPQQQTSNLMKKGTLGNTILDCEKLTLFFNSLLAAWI